MAQYFFDTSALVKYYHNEIGTRAVVSMFQETGRRIQISSLGFLEAQAALAMKVRSGFLNQRDAGIQRARFVLDIAAGDIEICRLNLDHFVSAERLIGRHGFVSRLRTLDALQLAVALDLRSQNLLDHFVVADEALAGVATIEGLPIIDPETA